VDRLAKKNTVAAMQGDFSEAKTVVVTHYAGMTVQEVTELRKKMNGLGAGFRVTKNRLAKLAVTGTQYDHLKGMFVGPTAVAFSDDPVAAAKGVVEFAKNNPKLIIIGGAIGGEVLSVDKVTSLAKLPSLDELRAKIVGMINTPATRIAGVVQAPAGQIARVLNAHSQQG
jgi:large subunit ribosomal protein L10